MIPKFQSRNRETYDSNLEEFHPSQVAKLAKKFQSRNRETYDSNKALKRHRSRFSLFQSRNRETYDSNKGRS